MCRCMSNYQDGSVAIPVTGFTPPYFGACPKRGPAFPSTYVVDFFMFSELRQEVVVRFVDNGGLVDHQSLFNLSFHNVLAIKYMTLLIYRQGYVISLTLLDVST